MRVHRECGAVAGDVGPLLSRGEESTTLLGLYVVVAAYSSIDAALADWDDVGRDPTIESNLIDAMLIERSERQVKAIHGCLSRGWARGSVASALVGRLSPSALIDGAIAGGVGVGALRFISRGLSRDAVNELGRVFETGSFVTLAVVERGPAFTTTSYGARALGVASLPLRGTAFELCDAVQADESDE
jgi:hypothetical protein